MAYVPPDGPREAAMVIVGEAPGRQELAQGRPFCGPSGEQLNDLLRRAGTDRSQVYVTNVVKTSDKTPSDKDIQDALPGLLRELTGLPYANVFVPMGNVALKALSAWKNSSITRYRGSLLETCFGGKMVPTLHPAWYMRGEWRYKPVVLLDLQKAVAEAWHWGLRRPERHYIIEPTFEQAMEGLRELHGAHELSVDIETFGDYIACVGLAGNTCEALCVPIMRAGRVPYWSAEQEAAIWRELQALLATDIPKIFQNGMFDVYVFGEHGIQVRNFAFDTMLAHHLLLPELPHGLDFLASVYSHEPYYKDEGKMWDHGTDDRQLWTYNLKDVVATLECKQGLELDLISEGLLDYFHEYVMALPVPLMDMRKRGILVDTEKLFVTRATIERDMKMDQLRLNALVGEPVNVKSPKDMLMLLNKLGIRITRTTPTGRPKLDDESLRVYTARTQYEELDLVFKIRKNRTMVSGFLSLEADAEGTYHPSYLIHGTKSGRLSSRGDRKGPQIQNIPTSSRTIFVPAPGNIFVGADLKQAEAMVVAWLARDELLMEFFRRRKDIHRFLASIVFNKPQADISKYPERYIAKRIGHGSNYLMGARKLTAILRNEGVYIQEYEAKQAQAAYFRTFPGILDYHKETEEVVKRTRTLITPFGRKRVFLGLIDDAAIREAISFVPQATVAEVNNRALIWLYDNLPAHTRVVTQVHDSVLLECPEAAQQEVIQYIAEAYDIPITINGQKLLIPVELSVGSSWGDMKELPDGI